MRRSKELKDFMAATSGGSVILLGQLLVFAERAETERLVTTTDMNKVKELQGRIAAYRALHNAILPTPRVVVTAKNSYT